MHCVVSFEWLFETQGNVRHSSSSFICIIIISISIVSHRCFTPALCSDPRSQRRSDGLHWRWRGVRRRSWRECGPTDLM